MCGDLAGSSDFNDTRRGAGDAATCTHLWGLGWGYGAGRRGRESKNSVQFSYTLPSITKHACTVSMCNNGLDLTSSVLGLAQIVEDMAIDHDATSTQQAGRLAECRFVSL